jgi:signal transduction histidine kinase
VRYKFTDPAQIKQVLIHLCTNAAHAMDEKGGILGINLKNVEFDDAAAQYHNLDPGRYVQLTVSDTGHGIDPEIRERIFDPYFTTKEVSKGTGMGLAVVHSIVKNHKGDVLVNSESGMGTTVAICFPVKCLRFTDSLLSTVCAGNPDLLTNGSV